MTEPRGRRKFNRPWKHIYGVDRKYTARVDRLRHGHRLPDADGPREAVIYPDGCSVVPRDNGSWTYTPAEVPA